MAGGMSFKEFDDRHLSPFIDAIENEKLREMTRQAGEYAQSIAAREASVDLGGDAKFSGWAPTLDTKSREIAPGKVMFMPTRSGAGPWTVAEFGRNQGNAGGIAGPGVNRSTGATARTKSGGVRKVRAFAARRWNGTTQGKGTASRVVAQIADEVPRIVDREVGKAIGKHFN